MVRFRGQRGTALVANCCRVPWKMPSTGHAFEGYGSCRRRPCASTARMRGPTRRLHRHTLATVECGAHTCLTQGRRLARGVSDVGRRYPHRGESDNLMTERIVPSLSRAAEGPGPTTLRQPAVMSVGASSSRCDGYDGPRLREDRGESLVFVSSPFMTGRKEARDAGHLQPRTSARHVAHATNVARGRALTLRTTPGPRSTLTSTTTT